MLHIKPREYNRNESVYIPHGAEKGDCPYCYKGVLRREEEVQNVFKCKEGYICAECGTIFLESSGRYFVRIAVWRNMYRQHRFAND